MVKHSLVNFRSKSRDRIHHKLKMKDTSLVQHVVCNCDIDRFETKHSFYESTKVNYLPAAAL